MIPGNANKYNKFRLFFITFNIKLNIKYPIIKQCYIIIMQ